MCNSNTFSLDSIICLLDIVLHVDSDRDNTLPTLCSQRRRKDWIGNYSLTHLPPPTSKPNHVSHQRIARESTAAEARLFQIPRRTTNPVLRPANCPRFPGSFLAASESDTARAEVPATRLRCEQNTARKDKNTAKAQTWDALELFGWWRRSGNDPFRHCSIPAPVPVGWR